MTSQYSSSSNGFILVKSKASELTTIAQHSKRVQKPFYKRPKPVFSILAACLLVIVILSHSVSKAITLEDEMYIKKILTEANLPVEKNFLKDKSGEEQLKYLDAMQSYIIDTYKHSETALPTGHSREPKDLYIAGVGACYDRSRVNEKIINYWGLETRHIFVFENNENVSTIQLLFKKTNSHATSSVQTANGWILVDSNQKWISIGEDGRFYSYRELRKLVEKGITVDWKYDTERVKSFLLSPNSTFFYGLYSRHGGYYAPYDFIPDYNLRELFYNF